MTLLTPSETETLKMFDEKRQEKDALRAVYEVWCDVRQEISTYIRHGLTSIRNYWLYGLGNTPSKVLKYGVFFDFISYRAYT
jgi:hypothetical protein